MRSNSFPETTWRLYMCLKGDSQWSEAHYTTPMTQTGDDCAFSGCACGGFGKVKLVKNRASREEASSWFRRGPNNAV